MGRFAIVGIVLFGLVPALLSWRLWKRERVFAILCVISVVGFGGAMGLGKWLLGVAAAVQALIFLILVLVSRQRLQGWERSLSWGVMGGATIVASTLLFDAANVRFWGLSDDITGMVVGALVVALGTVGALRRKIL